jgi:hypothetical protein
MRTDGLGGTPPMGPVIVQLAGLTPITAVAAMVYCRAQLAQWGTRASVRGTGGLGSRGFDENIQLRIHV